MEGQKQEVDLAENIPEVESTAKNSRKAGNFGGSEEGNSVARIEKESRELLHYHGEDARRSSRVVGFGVMHGNNGTLLIEAFSMCNFTHFFLLIFLFTIIKMIFYFCKKSFYIYIYI